MKQEWKFYQQVVNETYQETTKQISATVQLEFEGWGFLLQQIHPVETFIIIWAIIRDNAEVKPRAIAGLWGYTHSEIAVTWTWELWK